MLRDIFLCVCWRKMISPSIGPRDQLLDLLPCQNFDLSMDYRQVKSEPTMFVMLSYPWLIPRTYTITSFGLTNTIIVFTWWWKSSDMEIPMSCYWAHQQHLVSSMIHVEHPASVGNLCKHFLRATSWRICLDGRSDFLWSMCNRCKLPPWTRESLFLLPLESSQVSHAFVRSILWFGRLITSIPYVSLAHQATNSLVQGEGVPP